MSVASHVVQRTDFTRRRHMIDTKLTLSGNYPAGGETVDLTKLTNPGLHSRAFPGSIPSKVRFDNIPGGYTPVWVPGTTLANGKVKFLSAVGTDLAAAAYPAALTADPLQIELSGPTGKF
jgi:hypothetical protein